LFATKTQKNLTNFNISSLNKTLTDIKNNKLTITKADKNIGIILINTNLYNKLCIEHLVTDNTYKRVDFNPQYYIYSKAKICILNLYNTNQISKNIFDLIMPNLKYKKLAKFRILIKLHKPNKCGIRPLINCSNTTLSVLSKILDFIFKPIVMKHFSYIKDSQNLIQLTSKVRYEENLKLYSADFESLYTNIPLDKSIDIIMQMVSIYKFNDISIEAIFEILKLVLLNNYFSFKFDSSTTFLLQTKGIAMGTSCGPSVANLYLAYFENKYKIFLDKSLYHRFIDDVLYTDSENILTNKFKEIFPDLTLNCVTSDQVQFLDLNISFNLDRTLNFDLYIKPTFTGSYLNINSNHPKHVFKGIIISQVSRIRRNCTNDHNYYKHTTNLLFYLLKKGFSYNLITNIIRSFSKINRDTLIDYKLKDKNIFNNSLLFIFPHISNINLDNKFLNNLWYNNIPSNSNLINYNLKIIFKTTPNLNSYIINKVRVPFNNGTYFKCINHTCKICRFALLEKNLFNFNNIKVNLSSLSSCKSTNIIYAIHCIKCQKTYIGQSSRSALVRISEHIRNIKKIKKTIELKENEQKNDTTILYNHFKNTDHNINDHFKFQILCINIFNYRERLETDFMYILNTIHPFGLNAVVADYNNNFETYRFNF